MPKYVIERNLPGAEKLSMQELCGISKKSNEVLHKMGPEIQWMHSYVAKDKIYCVYIAPNPDMIRRHAKEGGFPVDNILEVKNVIDPATAEL